jgi:HK97 family phage prohead protease
MEKSLTQITKAGDSYSFIASTPGLDRHKDTVAQDFNLDAYLKNPIILFGHDHADPIGKAVDVRIEDGNLIAEIEFSSTERGQTVKTLVDEGVLRALSIGFISDDVNSNAEGGLDLRQNSLLEISVVAVPSNPDSLRIKSTQETEIMSDVLAPTPVLTPIVSQQPDSLMTQVEKAMPQLQSGQSFRTEVSRKAISGPGTSAVAQIALPSQNIGLINQTVSLPNRLIDLITRLPASAQSVSYVQVALSANNAAIVPELGLKPESQMQATSQVAEVKTWAHWTEASKQVLADVAGLQALVGGALIEGATRIVDAHIYSTLSTQAGAFIPTTSASDVVAEASLRLAQAGGTQSVVCVNPSDYLSMMTAKASGSGTYLGLSPVAGNVIACPSVAQGKILAFDRAAAAWFERESIGVFLGYHGDQFVRNAITILAELRGVAAVLDPNLVLFGDLPVAAAATTVNTGETPPMNPVPNTLWFRSSDATMMIWYDNAWVQISSGAAAVKK